MATYFSQLSTTVTAKEGANVMYHTVSGVMFVGSRKFSSSYNKL